MSSDLPSVLSALQLVAVITRPVWDKAPARCMRRSAVCFSPTTTGSVSSTSMKPVGWTKADTCVRAAWVAGRVDHVPWDSDIARSANANN